MKVPHIFLSSKHTWATEFPRVWVWVRVGYPQLTIYSRKLKNSGVQPTIYPTTCFKYIKIKFLLFLHVFSFISNEDDKIKFFKKSVVGYIVDWTPEYFGYIGHIVSCGYPTHTQGNLVAHVWLKMLPLEQLFLA